ncbi:MAG: hypothetical protein RJA70_1216 [Pseudomonadota bacterium]|jgi:hypothetical protein
MLEILRLWSWAFALTLGLEQLFLLVAAAWDKRKQVAYADSRWVVRWAAAVCFANVCTHPAVWFILPELREALGWSRATYLLLSETWAFGAEALLYWLVFPTLGLRRCLLRAALANLVSWQLGQWILEWLGKY